MKAAIIISVAFAILLLAVLKIYWAANKTTTPAVKLLFWKVRLGLALPPLCLFEKQLFFPLSPRCS